MKYTNKILDAEAKASFDFFWNTASTDDASYGLIPDNTLNHEMCSIASVGFGLAAICVGVHRGWITREAGFERACRTLLTMNTKPKTNHGFYYHFLHMDTCQRYRGCELSIIDTALLVAGALCAGSYFGGEVLEQANLMYERIDWDWYRNPETGYFYMGYDDRNNPDRHFGAWDMCAEQLIMYVLACGSPTHPLGKDVYYGCPMSNSSYDGIENIYHSPGGALFVYQFSHAFIDFRNKRDARGIDWFENSVKATQANRKWCINHSHQFKTYHANSWGLTACETPFGYSGAPGTAPSLVDNAAINDGTVAPCGVVGSVVFTPEESIEAMEYYARDPRLWSEYGFLDAYNLDVEPAWYSERVIGIDKGIGLLMIENLRSGLIWDTMMGHKAIQKGLEVMDIR
ncbi:MAG: hypothetical protein IKC09_10605 [Oscillospiraceae bacterium]|nr:hypothetical protein [Oscillospiraceae bacterium]MBR2890712.1 hypothetical protein [Oscillospiraceae bacterium]